MNILNINLNFSMSSLYKNLAEHLMLNKCSFRVYYPIEKKKNQFTQENSDYLDIDMCLNKVDRFVFFHRAKKIQKSILKKYKINEFDLLHAHSLFSNGYIAYQLYKKYHIPYVVAVRNTDVNLFFKKMFYLRRTGIKILRHAKKIIFISDTYKKQMIEKYIPAHYKTEMQKKMTVLPNGIDDFWIENEFKNKKKLGKEIHLLYVGTINHNKNLITVLHACELLKKAGYTVKYTVVGKAIDQKIFKALKTKEYVIYKEYVSKTELIKYYRENDIFIMPSITETFGLTYVEAMSQGLPVIYSKGQGFDGFFENGTVGYHVNSMDAIEIKERIIDILENYQQISTNCSLSYKKFNWDDISKKYIRVYNEL